MPDGTATVYIAPATVMACEWITPLGESSRMGPGPIPGENSPCRQLSLQQLSEVWVASFVMDVMADLQIRG
jgi:hypothetical protein